MKFTTTFVALISVVYAIPAPTPDLPDLSARAPGAVYVQSSLMVHTHAHACFVCANAPFVDPCGKFSGVSGECVNFPASFDDDISSVGPDSGQDCFFYVDVGCGGASLGPIRGPGIPDLFNSGFNDQISSFK
ncbi:hypothetical protein B0H17DRAFT_1147141 [Mycena rosella]|uniref:Uncharacterized protein n=1 Tax=Mycena rosella TaxID=1033263 RepID=A0AAD7G061_MYCRO|nr:hypothetical protein B0H17DRAFT_1147141 [Mycena rosella]